MVVMNYSITNIHAVDDCGSIKTTTTQVQHPAMAGSAHEVSVWS
ncbi:hypothetical protein [Undibacterium sp.]